MSSDNNILNEEKFVNHELENSDELFKKEINPWEYEREINNQCFKTMLISFILCIFAMLYFLIEYWTYHNN